MSIFGKVKSGLKSVAREAGLAKKKHHKKHHRRGRTAKGRFKKR